MCRSFISVSDYSVTQKSPSEKMAADPGKVSITSKNDENSFQKFEAKLQILLDNVKGRD